MTKGEIQDILLNFITRSFMVDREEINLDKSLIDEGIIDSFGLVEIVTFLETEFCMVVADDDMNRDNFGSVSKIVNFIRRQLMIQNHLKAVK